MKVLFCDRDLRNALFRGRELVIRQNLVSLCSTVKIPIVAGPPIDAYGTSIRDRGSGRAEGNINAGPPIGLPQIGVSNKSLPCTWPSSRLCSSPDSRWRKFFSEYCKIGCNRTWSNWGHNHNHGHHIYLSLSVKYDGNSQEQIICQYGFKQPRATSDAFIRWMSICIDLDAIFSATKNAHLRLWG